MVATAVLLVVVLLLVSGLRWAAGGKTIHLAHGSGIIESIPDAIEQYPTPSHTLSVMAWNLGYCLGTAEQPADALEASTVYDRLDHIVETIAGAGAEVVLLQAVDFRSRRTRDIDQLHYIATALGWGFAARALTWECRYIPYPIWPVGRTTGPVQAGMGVISRFPIQQNMRQRLHHPSHFLSVQFHPFATVQQVDVQCGTQTVRLFNVHLSGGAGEDQLRQARLLVAFVQQMATANSVLMGSLQADTASSDVAMTFIAEGLRNRMHRIDDKRPAPPEMPSYSRFDHLFVAAGLQHLETEVLLPQQPVTMHPALLTQLRWHLPMLTQDGRNSHERL